MNILLSNDDGIEAPGLHATAAALRRLGRVFVCAPEQPQSGASSALTIYRPLVVHPVSQDTWWVNGTPADAVKIALRELLPSKPDIVVSGINNGLNTGSNVLYSGTVAAALEGAQYGIPSFAVSRKFSESENFRAEAALTVRVLARLLKLGPRGSTVLNINLPPGKPRGVLATATELTPYDDAYDRRKDPRGRTYYWLRGVPPRSVPRNGHPTDDWAIEHSYVSVTPLQRDLTNKPLLEDLSRTLSRRR